MVHRVEQGLQLKAASQLKVYPGLATTPAKVQVILLLSCAHIQEKTGLVLS